MSGGCPHCLGDNVIVEDGIVCGTCRTVLSRQLDYGAEWRYYGAEDLRATNPTRCGPPSNGLIRSLGGVVSGTPRRTNSHWCKKTDSSAAGGGNGGGAGGGGFATGRTVQRFQMWGSLTYRERVLCGVFDQLALNAAQHGLPACILEDAKNLYKAVSDEHITRGENRAGVIAVSMYIACKRCGVPRSVREIAEMFDMKPTALTRACRTFRAVIGCADEDANTVTPMDFVPRFCSRLGIDAETTGAVRDCVEEADRAAVVSDAMPPSVVAGAIAVVLAKRGIGIDVKEIAAVCSVAPATATKMKRRLEKSMGG